MNRNSLMYWFPLIEDLDIPMPETTFMSINRDEMLRVLDGRGKWPRFFEGDVKELAHAMGYPLFLRTDQASGKHGWETTCYVENEDELLSHIHGVLDYNETNIFMGMDPYEALVFREFIPLASLFTAFQGLPIAKERRYFAKDGEVLCHHPYWIEDAVERGGPKREDWRSVLAEMNMEGMEIPILTLYSKEVSEVLEGYWSVDYAMSKRGRWYLIDCALGDRSWHPECDRK